MQEAAEKAKLASMTDEERRQWELENPKVSTRHPPTQVGTVSLPAKNKDLALHVLMQQGKNSVQ